MKNALSLGIVLGVVWLAWSGIYTPLLLTFGAVSVLFVVFIAHRVGITDEEGVPTTMLWRSLPYIPWLAKEIVVANIDVARRVLHPALPISPRLIRVRASQQTELTRVIYANSITLTPGTVSVALEGDEITVHALTAEAAESVQEGGMDRRVRRIDGDR